MKRALFVASGCIALLLADVGLFASAAHATDFGSSISEGTRMNGGDYMYSTSGGYEFILQQTDGNLVEYDNGTALWASGTGGNPGDYLYFGTDGNLVIYNSSGSPIWQTHTNYNISGATIQDQTDGNVVMYNGSSVLWNTYMASNVRDCWVPNSCSTAQFGYAFVGLSPQSPNTGANAPSTPPNDYAITKWALQEGMPSYACNPLATTYREPGSSNYNSTGVQQYANYNGETCWYWGISANNSTVNNPQVYGGILNTLRSPASTNYQQCVNLANAVAASPWGTANFSDLC